MGAATTFGSGVAKDATPVDRLQAQLEWLCTKGGGTLFEYLKCTTQSLNFLCSVSNECVGVG